MPCHAKEQPGCVTLATLTPSLAPLLITQYLTGQYQYGLRFMLLSQSQDVCDVLQSAAEKKKKKKRRDLPCLLTLLYSTLHTWYK